MKMTFTTIVGGGLIVFVAVLSVVVFVPTLVWNPQPTLVARPYSDQEARGRILFYSNGCNYCHTQYVRAADTAMGPVSEAGDYVYDNPLILGSERTGPDLSYIGRKRSIAWEVAHLKDPRKYSPLSIMPSYDFLPDEDLEAIAVYLFGLGDRVAAERMIVPPMEYAGLTNPLPLPQITPDAGTDPAPQGWSSWLAADLQEGKEIYVEYCMTCHGTAGNGLGTYAGTLSVTPANFKQEPFRNMPDDQWFWHVSEGVPGTVMPPWKESLTVDQRWKVIRYLQQIFARPIMRDPDEGNPTGDYAGLTNPVTLTVEVLEDAKRIYTRECSMCHGYAGTGDGIFKAGLQPPPPDFSDGSYGTLADPIYKDDDYYWRISEGLPWSAMPAWKTRFSQDDRWKLVHYIRSLFTQTETPLDISPGSENYEDPDIYKTLTLPETASFERGKQLYQVRCSLCHGAAGDGAGAAGQYLKVKPFDFRKWAGDPVDQGLHARTFAKITFGIKGTAMPSWGELLTVGERWDIVKFVEQAFIAGIAPSSTDATGDTGIAADVITLSKDDWTGVPGNVISADLGKAVYAANCETCHGATGKGDGPGMTGNASKAPAAFGSDLSFDRIFGRVRNGIPGGIMAAFQPRLPEADIWNVTAYVESLSAEAATDTGPAPAENSSPSEGDDPASPPASGGTSP
jgi:mono/diheme cytochrome c family protein